MTSGFDSEFTGRENIYLKGQILGINNKEIKEPQNINDDLFGFEEFETPEVPKEPISEDAFTEDLQKELEAKFDELFGPIE